MNQRYSRASIASLASVLVASAGAAATGDLPDVAPTHFDFSAATPAMGGSAFDAEEFSQLLASNEAVALTTFSPLPLQAATAPETPQVDARTGEDKLTFAINFAIWTPGIEGDIGVGRFSTHVNASFIDILNDTDSIIGLTGMMRVSKGKFGGYVGGSFNRMGMEGGRNNNVDITSTVGILNFGLAYELGRWAVESTATADSPARDMAIVLTAGGRYTALTTKVDFNILPDQKGDYSWVDPMIGAAVSVPIAQHFSLVASGEVGGFGVASDFAWSASLLFSWDFHIKDHPSSLQVGYAAVGDDYTSGSGRNRFEWNTIMHGLLLNFNIRF